MRHKYLRWCVTHQCVVGVEIRDKRAISHCRIVRLDSTLMRKVDLRLLNLYFSATNGKKPEYEFFWKRGSEKVLRLRSK